MPIQIGAKPDSGFDDPLGMLKDCHRRIENFLRVLHIVANRGEDGALSAEERKAVQAALEYFRVGGRRHNLDEEESLFPRLQSAQAPELEAVGRLENEHRSAEKDHATVERLFLKWLSSASLDAADRESLRDAANRLKALYGDHIRLEEDVVFPRAAEVLKSDAIAEMGEEFRTRRKVNPNFGLPT